jgi:hypothetical protein
MAEILADNSFNDDRRRVVNAGVQHGRDAQMANMRAIAELFSTDGTSTVIATRAARLVLVRLAFSVRGQGTNAFQIEVLGVVEIDTEDRIAAFVAFDTNGFEGAIAELDARYLADEEGKYQRTWSAIAGMYTSFNRHELPATTPDWVTVDRRPGATFEFRDASEFFRSTWSLTPHASIYAEAVHRLTSLGAVVTHVVHGTSEDGFDAEWRQIGILTVEGDRINRCELFDETDLDAALARFEELSRPPTRLENAATRTVEQFLARFTVRDWDAMAELLADDVSADDRRSVVNAGIRRGRDLEMANWRATEDLWTIDVRSTVATRGERLALVRFVFTSKDGGPQAFSVAALAVVEINDSNRIAEIVVIEADDIDTAFAELDARYLSGEGAVHARTWSLITRAFAALNQHELPPTAPGWVNIDHRSTQRVEADDLTALIRATWEVVPHGRVYIEAVHRLNDVGVAITYIASGTSQAGFDAEWRAVNVSTVDGDMINRSEIFDEADLDTALARFDELRLLPPRLENAVGRILERYRACFSAREWTAMSELLADDIVLDDRRRVVNAGVRRGREVHIADLRAAVEVGAETISSSVVATRGERLALAHARAFNRGAPPGEVGAEWLGVAEIDSDERMVAFVSFDLDDIDAAFAELDARYLAAEGAAYADTWSVIAGVATRFNRQELPATTPDPVYIDHRPMVSIEGADLAASIRAVWDITSDASVYIEAVHRLSERGAVITEVLKMTSQEGFDAELWMIMMFTVEGDLICGVEVFDEADLDAALASFDELSRPAPLLENAASQAAERFFAYMEARHWAAMADILADESFSDDRRRVVNAGLWRGRDVVIAELRKTTDYGVLIGIPELIAIRGQRLVLGCVRWSASDQGAEAFPSEALCITEVDKDGQIAAIIMFDPDDLEAAITELDARYVAGEAAAHSRTWSVVSGAYASMNRHELFATTPDWVNVDHRRPKIIEQGGLNASLLSMWTLIPDVTFRVEAVHRLTNTGAVCTHVAQGISQDGFDAEWRGVELLTVDGDLINRCEIFDETELDAALARFDELHSQARQLENVASQVEQRFLTYFAARDWDAYAEILSDDVRMDDRRHVVNAGVRHGRDAEIASQRAVADVGVTHFTSTVIAIRGRRLALCCYSVFDGWSGSKVLCVSEINAENQIVARVAFDSDDLDAAFAELDARYLAGEAAPHAHIWTAITKVQAAYNRHEVPPTTADCVNIDHRPGIAFAPGDVTAYIGATYDVAPDVKGHLEAVHRLGNLGVVVTEVVAGTSHEGFAFEWREVALIAFDGDLVCRFELFDEADLDAALARFDELQPQAQRLENAATRAEDRFLAYFAARNWAALAEILTDESFIDDRRPVVNAGLWDGRDAVIANLQALADAAANITSVIATRGERLALTRIRSSNRDPRQGDFGVEMLNIVEIDTDERIVAHVEFDPNDIDAAFEELEARYLVGEGAAHAHAWSVIARTYAAFNRHEFPSTTPDSVYIDHRPLVANDASDLTANIHATWELMDVSIYIAESVHRLSELGAVVTQTLKGTSKEGLDVEYRMIDILTVEGDLLTRVEVFDETDLDAALARFDELQPQAPRLENAASRVGERFWKHFAAREWAAMEELIADDIFSDDRRRVVNGGIRRGRRDHMADMRGIAEVLPDEVITPTVIATRGARLALTRISGLDRGLGPGEVTAELFSVVELDADNRIVAHIGFDVDDIDAAIAELDARYLAGEATPYANTWSAVAGFYAALNRHEILATPDWVNVDHRRATTVASGDMAASIRATWDLAPNITRSVEAVHRLDNLGAVVAHTAYGTSREGFDAEWRLVALLTFTSDLLSRCELFDEADLDAALARFDELHTRAPRLENAATRAQARFFAYYKAHDWAAIAAILADDTFIENRVRVVNTGLWEGRDVVIANMQALAEGVADSTSAVLAVRGERLSLTHMRYPNSDARYGEFVPEQLIIAEIDTDDRIAAQIVFDPDDIDAAFEDLDARYLAGEAAAHAHTWSVITEAYAAFNRHELVAADLVTVDHRRATPFESSTMTETLRAIWDVTPDLNIQIEAVHRLSSFGAVVTHLQHGTSTEGFDAEWRSIEFMTVDGDRINYCEIFDEADLDAALARCEELDRPPLLDNAATRTWARQADAFNRRDMDSFLTLMTADGRFEDRRKGLRIVTEGPARRKAVQAVFEEAPSSWRMRAEPIAIRGSRLELTRECYVDTDEADRPVTVEFLHVMEVSHSGLAQDIVSFDPDDIDAAIKELDARYLAGEAAPHAHAWSVIVETYAVFNRHEVPPFAPDSVNIDHRQGVAFAPGDLTAYIRAGQTLAPDNRVYIETVHRLSQLGAAITQVVRGTSRDGFEAEWRQIGILTVEGDRINRCELFDETDLDAALARFDELHPQAPRLENAASRVSANYLAHAVARDWDAITEMLADDYYTDDRRHVVGGGIHGRDAEIANLRAGAELGITNVTSYAIATRGERLVLHRVRYSRSHEEPEAFFVEILGVIEINADNRLAAAVVFDANDIDAAFKELEARYLAGEAAAHAETWSVMMRACAALNTREIFATTADFVDIDHRSLASIGSGDLKAYIRAALNDGVYNVYIEAVHRLGDLGAVVTLVSSGTSQGGFDGEWRMADVFTVEGDLISRCEIFNEADLDAALARFDELQPQAPRLENAAIRVTERLFASFAAGEWDSIREILANDFSQDDRRRVVGAGVRHGRDDEIADLRAIADLWSGNVTGTYLATRGERLDLMRLRFSRPVQGDEAFVTEGLGVGEINAEGRIVAAIAFDPDDIDAAFEELDARYLAGEAAAHSHTWSLITQAYTALNRRKLPPAKADWVNVDHRQGIAFAPGDMAAYIRAGMDLAPDTRIYIETVHRLNSLGAVITQVLTGTSHDGFDAEWREIGILTFEGDLISRSELYDETDLDAALTRFDELDGSAP